jgi:glutamate N-acetyltransferase/amino-acid N-acetyltransferase
MPVNLNLAPGMPVAGVSLAPIAAGIKSDGTPDLLLITLAPESSCAGVFTKNTFCAAPVTIAKQHLASSNGDIRAMLINSGNANAGTGQPGIDMAVEHCEAVASALNISSDQVLPYSTGVIGQLLPNEIMLAGIASAAEALGDDWAGAARSIMTTDTEPKLTSRQCTIDGETITVTGMAKGSGMIQPNMATMLAYMFTDAAVNQKDLQQVLVTAVATSFNAITVDSDTSTNDACMLSATGQSIAIDSSHKDWPIFQAMVSELALDLAQAIVRDGEGATKFITVNVQGGADVDQCNTVAFAIANSPLVKTAMFASDANVGRLLMAIGKTGLSGLDPAAIRVSIGDVCAFENGGIAHGYTEEQGAAVMANEEITVGIDLGAGNAQATVYTSDLSHDYVSINADYRS